MNDEKVGTICLRDVHKAFRGGRDPILKGVSVDFPPGKLTYILGPSGTGKSVLLKSILGLVNPDRGTIEVSGEDITAMRGSKLAKHRENFGMLFQNSALFDDFAIFENVAFPLREHTRLSEEEIHEKVMKMLAHLGMTSGADKYPDEISGGMKKRWRWRAYPRA